MESVKGHICRLCLTIVSDANSWNIEDVTKEILDVLLIKLNFCDKAVKHIMCDMCCVKLFSAFKFKSVCFYTDDTIVPYYDDLTPVDLREIYIKEKGNIRLSNKLIKEVKICRLCMEPVKGNITIIDEVQLVKIKEFVPEINFSMVRDPVICKTCLDAVDTHIGFIKNCLEIELRMNSGESSNQLYPFISHLKTEDIEIKSEENVGDEGVLETGCNEVEFDEKAFKRSHQQKATGVKKREKYRRRGTVHKCKKCAYYTKHRSVLNRHMLNHLDPSEVEWHKCDLCEYKSKRSDQLKMHKKIHSELKMYKCKSCPFETKFSSTLRYHERNHNDSSEIKWYVCHTCGFKTKHRGSLKDHLLTHRDASEVQMYNCDKCPFQAKRAYYLKHHKLKHEDDTKWYHCNKCELKTRSKSNLKKHELLIHSHQAELYKCDVCNYCTKYRNGLEVHSLRHKDASEIQWYECDRCELKTRFKRTWRKHMLRHRDESELKMYKCEKCDYQSKFQSYVKRHQRVHKNP